MSNNFIHKSPTIIMFLVAIIITSLIVINYSIIPMVLAILFVLFVIYFFRGWAKPFEFPLEENVMYSPCDGTIQRIEQNDTNIRIIIFLNIHNIHVQYTPFDCTVRKIEYQQGTFHPAYMLEKSDYNERQRYTLLNEIFGIVHFTQIAGQVARRVESFVKQGDKLIALTPIGMIKFGSRCDIVLEKRPDIQVIKHTGDRVYIGDKLCFVKKT